MRCAVPARRHLLYRSSGPNGCGRARRAPCRWPPRGGAPAGQADARLPPARRGVGADRGGLDAGRVHGDRAGERPALPARPGPGLGHGGVRHAAAQRGRAHRARAPRPGRAHARDPAPGRAESPRGRGYDRARRALDPDRLRRAPGRRRDAHRVDHRRLRGPRAGARAAAGRGCAAPAAAHRQRRRGERRDRRRPGAARPRLRRGQPRRGRPEPGHDRRRPLRRGPGHGRGEAVHGAAARASAGRGARGPGRADRAPARDAARGGRRPHAPRMIPPRVVLATANRGKLEELRALVAEWGAAEVLSLADFPGVSGAEETGRSYLENAVAKARTAASATGLPALADDSGLEVEALGGEPGVRSARYAPTDAARVARLLAELASVPRVARRACFRCVVALAWPGGDAVTAEGTCYGWIATAPSGSGGFGYDPVFVADELGCSFAAAPPAEKQRVSHRARAARALGARLAPS